MWMNLLHMAQRKLYRADFAEIAPNPVARFRHIDFRGDSGGHIAMRNANSASINAHRKMAGIHVRGAFVNERGEKAAKKRAIDIQLPLGDHVCARYFVAGDLASGLLSKVAQGSFNDGALAIVGFLSIQGPRRVRQWRKALMIHAGLNQKFGSGG